MPKVSPLQNDFSGGEYNPLYLARVDADRYKVGLATCYNYLPIIQGPVTRRPGTYFAGAAKQADVILIPFQFSVTQSYVIEMGAGYFRFWKNYGLILSGGVPYEITNTFSAGDLADFKWVQDNDVIYFAHPNYFPLTLSRFTDTLWTLDQLSEFGGGAPVGPLVNALSPGNPGPYIGGGTTGTILSVTSTVVPLTLTTSLSGLFNASRDIGRVIMVQVGVAWFRLVILGVSGNVATVGQIFNGAYSAPLAGGTVSAYRYGIWNPSTGYPSCVCFHEDRLVFSGVAAFPNRIDGSRTSDYKNFTPINPDGSVPDNAAYSFTLNANQLNLVTWMMSTEQALVAGSLGGEWTLRSSTNGEPITPTNVVAKLTSFWGSTSPAPARAGKSVVHVQRGGKKVRELMYRFEYAGFISTELTELAGHITIADDIPNAVSGVKALAYQQNPNSVIWALRNDGQLIACTFDHDSQSLRAGWHRHPLGGVGDSAGNPPVVTSITVIPSPDGSRDDLWLSVKRVINGSLVTYIEYLSKYFMDNDKQRDAHFLDAGLAFDNPQVISSISQANPAVINSIAHGLSNGDQVIVNDVIRMVGLNGLTFTITVVNSDHFSLNGFDSSALLPATGGTWRKKISTLSGLGHLEGETVQILADGAIQADQVVSSGVITLPNKAATVHVGYSYKSDLKLLPFESGSANGTALAKTRRTQRVSIYLYRTLGVKFGYDFNALDDLVVYTSDDTTGAAVPLFSGIASETVDSDYDMFNQFCIRQDTPFPGTVMAIAPIQETQDR